jgi:membrane protein
MGLARARSLTTRGLEWGRGLVDGVRWIGRVFEGLIRIELIDRSMAIAAQAMLALVPVLIVLASFLPTDLTGVAVDRVESLMGFSDQASDAVKDSVDVEQVRTQTGLIGLLITLFSATSFARAVQRMYERVWDLPHVGGIAGLRRSFLWLVGWLLTLQLVGLLGFVVRGALSDATVIRLVLQGVVSTAIWWWTVRLLLFGRISWRQLSVTAVLTGASLVAYSWGSGLVMPTYVEASAEQFGGLGLILAITTWLVGGAGILVVAAVVGRVLAEDEDVRRFGHRLWDGAVGLLQSRRRGARPGSGPGS